MKRKSRPKKVFVAGAAGFIGQRVCRLLAERDYQVHAHIYSDMEWERVDRYAVKCVKGDLLLFSDADSIGRYLRMENIPAVVYLVGSVDYRQEYALSRRINVDAVKAMLDQCGPLYRSGVLKKFIFGGSVASRGFMEEPLSEGETINEDRSYYRKGLSAYCDVKHEAEELVRRSGLPFIILEPGSLVGREIKGATTTNAGLVRKIIRGLPVLPGGASYTSADRAAEGFVMALESDYAGETFLLGGENMTMKDFAVLVRRIAGIKFPYLLRRSMGIPVLPAVAAKVLGSLRVMVNSQQALLGSAYHYIDWRKAGQRLGYVHSPEDLEREIVGILEGLAAEG